MENIIAIVVLSSLGIGLSLFFGIYLLSSSKWKNLANSLLALLLLALSIRTGKAIFYNFTDLPLFVRNIGLAANLAIGPLLYLYTSALTQKITKIRQRQYLHFIPASLYVILCWAIPNATGDTLWKLSYSLILLQSYLYVALSFRILLPNWSHLNSLVRTWCGSLILGLFLMWVVYGLIFLGVLPYHIVGAISFSLLMLILAFVGMNKDLAFRNGSLPSYQNSRLSQAEANNYLQQIKHKLAAERVYLQPDLTIEKLSKVVDLHPKTISEIINRCEGKNFVAFINSYRIEEAKKLLTDRDSNHKIAAVAYSCGFNSLSVFNLTFKNLTSLTPSEYRVQSKH